MVNTNLNWLYYNKYGCSHVDFRSVLSKIIFRRTFTDFYVHLCCPNRIDSGRLMTYLCPRGWASCITTTHYAESARMFLSECTHLVLVSELRHHAIVRAMGHREGASSCRASDLGSRYSAPGQRFALGLVTFSSWTHRYPQPWVFYKNSINNWGFGKKLPGYGGDYGVVQAWVNGLGLSAPCEMIGDGHYNNIQYLTSFGRQGMNMNDRSSQLKWLNSKYL